MFSIFYFWMAVATAGAITYGLWASNTTFEDVAEECQLSPAWGYFMAAVCVIMWPLVLLAIIRALARR